MKVEPNPDVCNILGKIVKESHSKWGLYSPRYSTSYEDYSLIEIPKSKNIIQTNAGMPISSINDDNLKKAMDLLGCNKVTNSYMMGPNERLGWHTNSNLPGFRTYYTLSNGKSLFKYLNPETGEVIEDWDNPGWTARTFKVSGDNLFWHSVWTGTRRFSFGFST